MTEEQCSLIDAWQAHAREWIAWARRPGFDSYDVFHRDLFLPLVPPPGRLTVEVGCGEGRVCRDLEARGHRVLAVDLSPAMAQAAATHPDHPVPVVVADATVLPLPSASVDCVVSFMAMHDTDDMPAAVAEIGRVLAPGGRLVLAIVHPLNSAGDFTDTGGEQSGWPYVITGSYLEPARLHDTFSRDGLTMTFNGEHRPLQAYTEALYAAGLLIERLREPTTCEPARPWRRIPLFLHIVAVRP
ncbi:MAG TPA: class I SAM-dependent methyltransferase [Streptosporangiaceae bacterium]|jgi:SAM-dependent methyltransferase